MTSDVSKENALDGSKHGWETVEKEGTGGWEKGRLGARTEASKQGWGETRKEARKDGRQHGLRKSRLGGRNGWEARLSLGGWEDRDDQENTRRTPQNPCWFFLTMKAGVFMVKTSLGGQIGGKWMDISLENDRPLW